MNDTAATARVPASRQRAPQIRIHHEPGYVLHATPYKETSLVAQVFTRHHGRVALIAKGAKRPHSALRNALSSLQPLLLDWTGRGDVKTLTGAHWVGGQAPLRGRALLCGFYCNELLLRLLAREDAHEDLFDAYVRTLARLGLGACDEAILRSFERALLAAIGLGIDWTRCANGTPVEPDVHYVCVPEYGIRPMRANEGDLPVVEGRTLLDLAADDFGRPRTAQQSKQLMRSLINHALTGRPINARQILIDLHAL
ncbi:MAG TPA: DNA repair protein RecO [Burkholderiaceae bacterium]|nr:DNA repair protein RecO [Burkholderiaceae bacterium]